ncbi:MAG: phage portal protein [Plesiomonas sp.]
MTSKEAIQLYNRTAAEKGLIIPGHSHGGGLSLHGNNSTSATINWTNIQQAMYGTDTGNVLGLSGYGAGVKAYNACGPLKTIINYIATAHVNGRHIITNSRGQEASGSAVDKYLYRVNNPNGFESGIQFNARLKMMIELEGWAVIVPFIPAGYDITDAQWVIVPHHLCGFEFHTGFNQLTGDLKRIYVNYGGTTVWYQPGEVFLIQSITPNLMGSMTIPHSKWITYRDTIEAVSGAINAEKTIVHNRGPQGILSPESDKALGGFTPWLEGEREKVERGFQRRYGITGEQLQFIVGQTPVKYVEMGYNIAEMGTIEVNRNGSALLCNAAMLPPFLLGLQDATYKNYGEAREAFYTNNIIPSANNIWQQIGSYILPKGYTHTVDYSHLPELQEDRLKTAQAERQETETALIKFCAGLTNVAVLKKSLKIETLPGDESLYYIDVKDSIDLKMFSGNGQQQTNNQQPDPTAGAGA